MKTLQTYLECGEGYTTPDNTMGMGNPGEIGPDTLSEPITTAKSEVEKDKKKRKKKIKSLSESLFDNNIKKKLSIEDLISSMTYDNMINLSREDATNYINAIIDTATEYSLDKLKKSRIDLSKYILVTQWIENGKPAYPYDTKFYFKKGKNVVMSRLLPSMRGYYWDWYKTLGDYESIKNDWINYINVIKYNDNFSGGVIKFFVLNKIISKELINSISERQ